MPPWCLLVAAPGLCGLRLLPLGPAPPLTPAALVCYHAVHRSRPLTPAANERDTLVQNSDRSFGNGSVKSLNKISSSCLLVTEGFSQKNPCFVCSFCYYLLGIVALLGSSARIRITRVRFQNTSKVRV